MKARHKDTGEIIELAEEGIISCDGRRFCWYQVELIPEPIDDFKLSLPSNIDEAAEEYVKDYGYTEDDYKRERIIAEEHFKAGAKWQKSQMMKEAVEADVFDFSSNLPRPYAHISLPPNKYHTGDKIRIIIVKEE